MKNSCLVALAGGLEAAERIEIREYGEKES
jgi:hypothetical protein